MNTKNQECCILFKYFLDCKLCKHVIKAMDETAGNAQTFHATGQAIFCLWHLIAIFYMERVIPGQLSMRYFMTANQTFDNGFNV